MGLLLHQQALFFVLATLSLTHLASGSSKMSEIVKLPYINSADARYMFDITNDPYESTNVYGDSAYSEIYEKLESRRQFWSELTLSSSSKSN